MAKKDASKYLGGMAGKAASQLRGRGAKLDAAISGATTGLPRKPSVKNSKAKRK